MRAVLDANVLISALLSSGGAPRRVLEAWQAGAFELITSARLLEELRRALDYPKLRRYVSVDEADEFIEWLRRSCTVVKDPDAPPPIRSTDPGDDYLIALAAAANALLVSGDSHLLSLADELPRDAFPIHAPAAFLKELERPTS